jgi:hydrogenase/urease accessory protein HupE
VRRLLIPVAVLAAWLVAVRPAVIEAHEIGKTQVAAAFEPAAGTYQVDIAVDPDALLARLQILNAGRVGNPADRAARDREIAALANVFLGAVHLKFDGRDVRPHVEYRAASALSDLAQAPSSVRLTGKLPEGAREFSFSYGLTDGTFALVVRVGASPAQTVWLESGRESAPVSLAAPPPPLTSAAISRRYLVLGFTHIVPQGLDHILFVLGLFLLSTRWRSVLLQVSTFTVAHSITLGLTIYGVVSLPARVVEPMIALSIAYVAIENMLTAELKSWRVALVFSFGLLHGMGFAGVLRDLGLPRGDFLTALVTFNLGVEAGQLTVVAAAFLLLRAWRCNDWTYRRLIAQPASVAIALTGVYWIVQRLT